MGNITDEGALLILVNRHNNKYNGTLCQKANSHKCGAQEYFRKNYCSKDVPYCNDIRLFCEDGNANVLKILKEHETRTFDQVRDLLSSGKKPIFFFYTTQIKGAQKNYYLAGIYVVREIKVFAVDFGKFEYQLYPEVFVRLPLDMVSNASLWNSSLPDSNLHWVRQVYKSAVIPALDEIQKLLLRSDAGEYGKYVRVSEDIIRQLSGEPMQIEENLSAEKSAANLIENKVMEKHIIEEAPSFSEITDDKANKDIKVIRSQFERLIDQIRSKAANKGFYYSEKIVRTICSNLMINPLLVLSGISGGGKSSFAQFYSEATNGEFLAVSVRPDWTNPSHLLGVYNPFTKDFVPTPFTNFIREAGIEWEKAKAKKREPRQFVILLDEMNLARVEYYFSDFLSKMQLPQEELRKLDLYCENEGSFPHELLIPGNIKIIGTVNIDETTFLFSPKVLDRASYINLNEINIDGMGEVIEKRADELRNLEVIKKQVLPELRDLNYKLAEFDQPFGYRTAWDIIRWIDYSLVVGNVSNVYEGIDIQVESRVLIKLSDTRRALIFNALKAYFEDRNDRQSSSRPIYERCLQRLDNLINRAMRDEYAIGQQF